VDDLTPLVFRTHDGGKTWTPITRGMENNAPVNVVRADPKAKGLLFAGTERAVYVSFNDGDDWQPLSLNLPHTSVRDLIVKGDDLVVATHGRGFWILDNMTPLRYLAHAEQYRRDTGIDPLIIDDAVVLYPPQVAYRLRRNQNTDTPLPPEVPAGQNPPDGAIIDYYLPDDMQKPVTLEVLADGANVLRPGLVRRFSSDDKPEPYNEKDYNVPMYWARQPRALPTTKGMHRFVWDLRYPPPSAVERDFPISAIYKDTPLEPQGVLALPGRYTIILHTDHMLHIEHLSLKMDPRAKITPLGLHRQWALGMKIASMMNESYAALQSPVASRRSSVASRRDEVRCPEGH
jgi:hypothetical protein